MFHSQAIDQSTLFARLMSSDGLIPVRLTSWRVSLGLKGKPSGPPTERSLVLLHPLDTLWIEGDQLSAGTGIGRVSETHD